MAIAAGVRFNHYEIIAQLGAGGMGEVWRARDTRLDREVAIKVLPANYAYDEDRLRRFEQEARATSALNHPNILIVHDLGIHEGAPKALFKTRMLTGLIQSGIEYDVTADGQRFLIGTMVGEANASPVSVILNWTAEAPR